MLVERRHDEGEPRERSSSRLHAAARAAIWILALTVLTACGARWPATGQPGGPSVGGTIRVAAGQTLPSAGKVALVWQVTAGQPDYLFVHGSGRYEAADFRVDLGGPPPAAALNEGLGVGFVIMFRETGPADGRIGELVPSEVAGAASRHAVIYIAEGIEVRGWLADFPRGYSCGRGVPGSSVFESFERVDCDALELVIDDFDDLEFVNWT